MQNHIQTKRIPNSRTAAYIQFIITSKSVRSLKRLSKKHINKQSLFCLTRIFNYRILPPMNPYYYWVNKELSEITTCKVFPTVW